MVDGGCAAVMAQISRRIVSDEEIAGESGLLVEYRE